MKKLRIIAALLAAALICACFAGCVKQEGYWELSSVEGRGATTEEEVVALKDVLGGPIYLYLKADKTVVFNFVTEVNEGTYTNKVISIDGNEMKYRIKGDKLYLETDEGSTMIFGRSSEAGIHPHDG